MSRSTRVDPAKLPRLFEVYDVPPGSGPELAPVPWAVPARDVFTPEELSARLDAMAERVAREEPPRPGTPLCWACGAAAPRATHVAACGWHCRRLRYAPTATARVMETYCPDCYSRWGWGDGPATEGRHAAG